MYRKRKREVIKESVVVREVGRGPGEGGVPSPQEKPGVASF